MSTPVNGGTALRIHVRRRGDDRPVPAATLTVLDADGGQVARGQGGDDGVFRTGLPRPGEYLLIAAAAGHEPRSATLSLHGPGEHDVDVVLPGRQGAVTGTVAGPAGPVPGATVVVHDVRGEVVATTTTDADGGYSVGDLSPAVYTVVAVAPDTEPVTDSVVVDTSGDTVWNAGLQTPATGARVGAGPHVAGPGVTAGRGVTAGQGTAAGPGVMADGRTGRGVGLAGTARTAGGRPVPDARVVVLRADGSAVAITDTDADGRYAFPTLPPGDYTVITTGYPPVTDALRVDTGVVHDPVLGHPKPR